QPRDDAPSAALRPSRGSRRAPDHARRAASRQGVAARLGRPTRPPAALSGAVSRARRIVYYRRVSRVEEVSPCRYVEDRSTWRASETGRLWLMGERVDDVTTHPALAGCARSVAAVYDLQPDAAYQEL